MEMVKWSNNKEPKKKPTTFRSNKMVDKENIQPLHQSIWIAWKLQLRIKNRTNTEHSSQPQLAMTSKFVTNA